MTQRQNAYRPTTAEIDELIRRAERHPLGTSFLMTGALDAVAATFRVHAFAVDAAREALRAEQEPAVAARI